MTLDYAPQAMLFGIAIDLALLGIIYMRMSKDYYLPQMVALILVLGLGSVLGFARSAYLSPRAWDILPLYELLLPFVFWLQLTRFLPRPNLQWVPLPIVIVVGVLALVQGWEFQSTGFLIYELVFLLALVGIVIVWSMKGTLAEGEMIFLLSALIILLIFGPAYGFLWTDLQVHFTFLSITGGAAAAIVVAGRMRTSFLHFTVPRGTVRAREGLGSRLGPGIFLVGPDKMKKVRAVFLDEVRSGRFGLWISMDPVARVRRKAGLKGKDDEFLVAQLTHADFAENPIEPSDTGMLRRSLAEYLKRTGDGIIFIVDGHYLVSNTDVWEVAEVLSYLDTKVNVRGTILLGSDLLAGWEIDHLRKSGAKDLEGMRPQ